MRNSRSTSFGSPSQAKVCTRNAGRPTAELRQHKTSHLVDHGFMRLAAHEFAPPLHQTQCQHLGLGRNVSSIGFTARRLLPLAPQVSQVGNAALVEREATTLPLDHAFGFELADVGPAAIEMRQCRRADGRGLSGSRSRERLGDGRAINRDGRSNRVCSCCVAVISLFTLWRHSGPFPTVLLAQHRSRTAREQTSGLPGLGLS
ncbi:hypothetical protein [Bradyrhizobium sp. F1.13.3]|uniref:hypothetical protein n=1 Tax=Bradyrhizobium sp. F1.13.3 TaxID=3156351 RepID=UPI00339161A8